MSLVVNLEIDDPPRDLAVENMDPLHGIPTRMDSQGGEREQRKAVSHTAAGKRRKGRSMVRVTHRVP